MRTLSHEIQLKMNHFSILMFFISRLGIQTRTVQCSTNGSPATVKDTSLCESQSLIALDDLVSRDCYVACPDECVVESWSEWSACDRDCSEQRKRTRRVLRQDKNLQCNDTELIQV